MISRITRKNILNSWSNKIRQLHTAQQPPFDPTNGLKPLFSQEGLAMNLNQYNMHLSKLNSLIKGTTYENLSLFETIRQASVRFEDRSIYEHATQVYSNQLFLESYVPELESPISSGLLQMINRRSESLDAFKDELVLESKALFGSGWLWVGQTNSYIHVSTTLNGECGFFPYRPQKDSVPVEQIQPIFNPLFCINLWGSSYLFDYGLDKESYIKNAINNITWDAVVKRQLSFNAANKSY